MGLMDAARVRFLLSFSSRKRRARLALALCEKRKSEKKRREAKEKKQETKPEEFRFFLLPPIAKRKTRPRPRLPPFLTHRLLHHNAPLIPPLCSSPQSFIERNMQSAEDRDRWWAAYTRQVDGARQKIKAAWALPTKAPGFWRSPLSEARFETAHAPGIRSLRRKTIDEE